MSPAGLRWPCLNRCKKRWLRRTSRGRKHSIWPRLVGRKLSAFRTKSEILNWAKMRTLLWSINRPCRKSTLAGSWFSRGAAVGAGFSRRAVRHDRPNIEETRLFWFFRIDKLIQPFKRLVVLRLVEAFESFSRLLRHSRICNRYRGCQRIQGAVSFLRKLILQPLSSSVQLI